MKYLFILSAYIPVEWFAFVLFFCRRSLYYYEYQTLVNYMCDRYFSSFLKFFSRTGNLKFYIFCFVNIFLYGDTFFVFCLWNLSIPRGHKDNLLCILKVLKVYVFLLRIWFTWNWCLLMVYRRERLNFFPYAESFVLTLLKILTLNTNLQSYLYFEIWHFHICMINLSNLYY